MSDQREKGKECWTHGLVLGLGISVAVGVALDNIAVGIGVGADLGLAFYSLSSRRKAENPSANEELYFF